ncbi:MAG TPA: hypothetical protein VF941_06405 [Clostridia bacterium]
MPNVFWYICLAVIGLGTAAYTIYAKRNIYKISTLLVFYLFSASSTWIGEFTVLGIFNSYAYKTGVFKDIWAQNLLGHLILNTTLYPASAVVMVAYSLKYGWISFVAVFFVIVEYIFMKMGIYGHNWWKYYMTAVTAVTFLLIARKWFYKMNQKRYGLIRNATFYFVAMIVIHTPAPVLLLLGKQYYHIKIINDLAGDLYLSSIIIIFIYHLIESFLAVLFTCILKKWYYKVFPFVISIVTQTILAKMNILVVEDGWKLAYTLFIYELFIAFYILLERYTLKNSGLVIASESSNKK